MVKLDKVLELLFKDSWFMVLCFVLMMLAIGIDLIVGIQKAKKNNLIRISEKYRQTTQKFILYFGSMAMAVFADMITTYYIISYHNFIPDLPYFLGVVTFWQIYTEFKSIRESADDKLQKATNRSAKDLLEFLKSVKEKEVLEYLEKINKNDNNN